MNWTVPEGWRRVESDSQRRIATFRAGADDKAIDIAVTSFQGRVGGLLANVNRWRQQLGLGSVQQAPDPIAEFHEGKLHGQVFQIPGADSDGGANPERRTLVAMLHGSGHTWFVKTTDAPGRVEAQRSKLIAFARSLALKSPERDNDGAGG